MFRALLLALAVAATISAPLQAQRGRGSLGPGDRVQVTTPDGDREPVVNTAPSRMWISGTGGYGTAGMSGGWGLHVSLGEWTISKPLRKVDGFA